MKTKKLLNKILADNSGVNIEKLEKIARLISTPPTAFDRFCRNEVLTCDSEVSLKRILQIMADTGYNNIPVYQMAPFKHLYPNLQPES